MAQTQTAEIVKSLASIKSVEALDTICKVCSSRLNLLEQEHGEETDTIITTIMGLQDDEQITKIRQLARKQCNLLKAFGAFGEKPKPKKGRGRPKKKK